MPNRYVFIYIIIAQILFFIITLILIIWFVKNSNLKDGYSTKEILDKRLVSGEITIKEYNSLLKLTMIKEE
jgi:uncharacterized membrane protein